jgi:hypothetical protein
MINSTILMTCTPEDIKQMIREVLSETKEHTATPSETRFLTRHQVCELLHISLTTLDSYSKKGAIKGSRIGTRILYASDDIHKAVREMPNLRYSRKHR